MKLKLSIIASMIFTALICTACNSEQSSGEEKKFGKLTGQLICVFTKEPVENKSIYVSIFSTGEDNTPAGFNVVKDENDMPLYTTVSDKKGNFEIDNVPIGKYILLIEYFPVQKPIIPKTSYDSYMKEHPGEITNLFDIPLLQIEVIEKQDVNIGELYVIHEDSC